MGKDAPFHLLVLVVVGHVVVADEIGDAGDGDGRLEHHAQAIAIDPQVAAHGGVQAVEHVLRLVSVLVGEDQIRPILSVSSGASVVDHQRGPPMRGIHLVLEVERRALLAMGSAMDYHDERVLAVGTEVDGSSEEGLDQVLVIVADEGE